MTTRRFLNPWDDTLAVAGSVYATPVYPSGSESGQALYTAPATKHFQAGQGGPARHVNWALKNVGDASLQAALHKSMGSEFRGAKNWQGNTIDCAVWSPTNRQFVVGSHSSSTASVVSASREADSAGTLVLESSGAFPAQALLDDGSSVWAFVVAASLNGTRITSSTATGFTVIPSSATARSAAHSSSASLIVTTDGTNIKISTLSGTTASVLSTTTTGFDASTTATWFMAQPDVAQGPVVFATRGTVGTLIWSSADGTSVTSLTRPDSTHYLAGLAYDDVQGLFVACTTTAGVMSFYSSPDGSTWSAMSGPVSPSNATITGNLQFDICCGVWLIAGNQLTPTGFVHGMGAALQTFGMYSLDYGVTWYPCDFEMLSPSADSVHVRHSDSRFMVWTDSDIAISGRLGTPTHL